MTERAMPTAAPNPRAGLLIFDGDCGFCTTCARFVTRWVDRRRRYDTRPWQQVDLAAVGLTQDDCLAAAQFVRPDGGVAAGHRAIAEALRRGSAPWRPVGVVLAVPGVDWLAGRAYAWVAGHRYVLPGGTPACAPRTVPTSSDRTPQ